MDKVLLRPLLLVLHLSLDTDGEVAKPHDLSGERISTTVNHAQDRASIQRFFGGFRGSADFTIGIKSAYEPLDKMLLANPKMLGNKMNKTEIIMGLKI